MSFQQPDLQKLSERKFKSIQDFCKHLRALGFGVRRTTRAITIYMPSGHGLHYDDTSYLMQEYSLCFSVGAQLSGYSSSSGYKDFAHVTFVKRPPSYWHDPVTGQNAYGEKREK